jgi:hypothetical protein
MGGRGGMRMRGRMRGDRVRGRMRMGSGSGVRVRGRMRGDRARTRGDRARGKMRGGRVRGRTHEGWVRVGVASCGRDRRVGGGVRGCREAGCGKHSQRGHGSRRG